MLMFKHNLLIIILQLQLL